MAASALGPVTLLVESEARVGLLSIRVSVSWAGLGSRAKLTAAVRVTPRVIWAQVNVTIVSTTQREIRVRTVPGGSSKLRSTACPAETTAMATQTSVFNQSRYTPVLTVKTGRQGLDVTRVFLGHSACQGH